MRAGAADPNAADCCTVTAGDQPFMQASGRTRTTFLASPAA